MCNACLKYNTGPQGYHLNAAKNIDPSGTLKIQNQFFREIKKRLVELMKIIRKSIVEEDCFGLKEQPKTGIKLRKLNVHAELASTGRKAFEFKRSDEKIEAFMSWLNEQEEKGLLEVIKKPGFRGTEEAWSNLYIKRAYSDSLYTAQKRLKKVGVNIPDSAIGEPGRISAALDQPFHADRLGVLYTRTFSELKGIDKAMDQMISRSLADGMLAGDNPRTIAKELTKIIGGKITGRAETLARTEIMRAHTVATCQEYRSWGVKGIRVKAEWLTAGYNVCPLCTELEGRVFTVDTIEKMLPRHPRCRCTALPYLPEFEAEENARIARQEIPISERKTRKSKKAKSEKARTRKPKKSKTIDKKKETAKEKKLRLIKEEKAEIARRLKENKWIKAKTIAEAKAGASENGIKYISENKHEFVGAGNLPKDLQVKFSDKDFVKYTNTLGENIKRLHAAGVEKIDVRNLIYATQKEGIGAAGGFAYSPPNSVMSISISRPIKAAEKLSFGKNKFSQTDNIGSIVRHEYGHGVYAQNGKIRNAWNKFHADLGGNKTFSNSIGRYAGTNPEEAFCECLSIITSKRYDRFGKSANRLVDVEKFFKDWGIFI